MKIKTIDITYLTLKWDSLLWYIKVSKFSRVLAGFNKYGINWNFDTAKTRRGKMYL